MVKDIIVSAMYMLGLHTRAYEADLATNALTDFMLRFLRYANLVIDEIASEYRSSTEVAQTYYYLDEVPAFEGITLRMMAYGVAAEYCITEGMEEAVTWDKRYKDALAAAKRKPIKIKQRKFLGGG